MPEGAAYTAAAVRRRAAIQGRSLSGLETRGSRLAWALPLTSLIGIPSLIATRLIHAAYHPESYVGTLPSISGTSTEPPSSFFFMGTMLLAATCIVISWSLVMRMNLRRLAGDGGLRRDADAIAALVLAACSMGSLAGFFLAFLGAVNLTIGHDLHMAFSVLFFVCQILAFLLDGASAVLLRRRFDRLGQGPGRIAVRAKLWVGGAAFVVSLIFLYLFLTKDDVAPANQLAVLETYVAFEYTLAFLCFSYPLTAFREIRRFYGALASP